MIVTDTVGERHGRRPRLRALRRRARGPLVLLVAAVLACLGGAILEESFTHTDDGCAVEVHCLACRLAAATAAVVEAAGLPPITAVPSASVVPAAVVLIAHERPVFKPSRAPPSPEEAA